jgi:hypothetical protein
MTSKLLPYQSDLLRCIEFLADKTEEEIRMMVHQGMVGRLRGKMSGKKVMFMGEVQKYREVKQPSGATAYQYYDENFRQWLDIPDFEEEMKVDKETEAGLKLMNDAFNVSLGRMQKTILGEENAFKECHEEMLLDQSRAQPGFVIEGTKETPMSEPRRRRHLDEDGHFWLLYLEATNTHKWFPSLRLLKEYIQDHFLHEDMQNVAIIRGSEAKRFNIKITLEEGEEL